MFGFSLLFRKTVVLLHILNKSVRANRIKTSKKFLCVMVWVVETPQRTI